MCPDTDTSLEEALFDAESKVSTSTTTEQGDSKKSISPKATPMKYFKWNDNSVKILLQVWEKIAIRHSREENYVLSTKDYQEMSRTLKKEGYRAPFKRCEDKVQHLAYWYNEVSASSSLSLLLLGLMLSLLLLYHYYYYYYYYYYYIIGVVIVEFAAQT